MVLLAETLRTTLGDNRFAVLTAVAELAEPASGRTIATALGVSPTTASEHLSALEAAGLVRSTKKGRSSLWSLDVDSDLVRSWLRETGGVASVPGASPASTGGAGVTFERKVVASLLARLLVGDGAVGLDPDQRVVAVAMQQAPEFTVDDVVVKAARDGEVEPSMVMAMAARRTPVVVQSDAKSQKLFRGFVQQLMQTQSPGPELRLGLAVSGSQDHADELKVLAGVAASQSDAAGFFGLVRTLGRFNNDVQRRLVQVEGLVKKALVDLGVDAPPQDVVERWTYGLLSRLVVWSPRMEGPDDTDWADLPRVLQPFSAAGTLLGGTLLRDRLLALADEWAPVAASADRSLLRRRVHALLDSLAGRHSQGWRALALLGEQARTAVDDAIVSPDGARRLRVDRGDVAAALMSAVESSVGVVLHGESGVGKSSIALALAHESVVAGDRQVVCLNLRHLPGTVLEFEALLGAPLAELLGELSAPSRIVVVDGADALIEGKHPLLTYVARAAVVAEVRVLAVAASDTRQLVADTVGGAVGKNLVEVPVPSLTDAQVDIVVAEFEELAAMALNPPSRELLRRPVVVQLLVRGGVEGVPVSDLDAMNEVWDGLVLRPDRLGRPAARELAMVQLARQPLTSDDVVDVAASLDPDAVEGLRRDGLLRTSTENSYRLLPEFTHDEVRRYAVARALLGSGEDPTVALAAAGVPRWALSAARLACQAKLVEDASPANPMTGRFVTWQDRFDALVDAGGERWGDVPGEAMLTLGDPRALLQDAWQQLRADDGVGVQRLARLVDQRLRGENAFVRVAPVEPLIELLLDDEVPWQASKPERSLLLDWLRALAMSGVPEGHELRGVLRARLTEFCAAADERLRIADEEREAERVARDAAMTDEDRAAQEARLARLPKGLFQEIGYPRSRTLRERPRISREITDEVVVELFALLGPDLGDDGEAALRRVAQADPRALQPAVEGISCGHALAGYRRGFLAEMVLAYYLDEDEDGLGGHLHDDGIRDHTFWGIGTPLSAHWKGPFMALFQTDPVGGVAALNKMLNHAALVRARTLTSGYYGPIEDSDLDQFRSPLDIAGTRRVFVGDANVWNWYRGTGVGPYPCLSGLQALERVSDNIIGLGVPLRRMVSLLLDGCENIAMVALVVGLIVRHVEDADALLDPFLAEPDLWHLEFNRVVHEHGFLLASSEGIVHAERRQWSLREAAASLVLTADPDRAAELRAVGKRLIERSRERIEQVGDSATTQAIEIERNTVRGWASGLDQSSYSATETDEGWFIASTPPSEVTTVLSEGLEWVQRSQRAMRFTLKYHINREDGTAEPVTTDALVADLDKAAALRTDAQGLDDMEVDGIAAVAAVALQEHLRNGLPLPDASVKIAAEILLGIVESDTPLRDHSIDDSYFSQGADRSAARALPPLLKPGADHARRVIDGGDGTEAQTRILSAVATLASSTVLQTRLFLARGLDDVWSSPCTHGATCVHQTALRITTDMMRECVLGEWNVQRQAHLIEAVADPVVDTLPAVAGKDLRVSRLDPAIRAFGTAASIETCVTAEARALLDVTVNAQRRALLARERDGDVRGTHALSAARALLSINDDHAVLAHVDAYIDNPSGLYHALGALSAAAEERPALAECARRVWPAIVDRVLDAHAAGHTTFDRDDRDYTMGALLPNFAGDGTYLHAEHDGEPIAWWDPAGWQDMVQRWLGVAAGKSKCTDRLVRFITAKLSQPEQVRLGLSWVSTAVLADPTQIASRCYNVAPWLIEIRSAAQDAGALNGWQRTVDALVVGGDRGLAPYSE